MFFTNKELVFLSFICEIGCRDLRYSKPSRIELRIHLGLKDLDKNLGIRVTFLVKLTIVIYLSRIELGIVRHT